MRFAVISPTSGLDRYSSKSNLQMVLAHLWEDNRYRQFYMMSRDAGNTVILDNGAYENGEPMEMTDLIEIIEALRPQITILPDYLLQRPHHTISASLRALDQLARYEFETEYMFVPQAEAGDIVGILNSIETVVRDVRVGHLVKWIGLPRALYTHFNGLRAWFAWKTKDAFPQLKLHALGSGAGSLSELGSLKMLCESMDSSTPVWRGWNSCRLGKDEWVDKPVDFDAEFPGVGSNADIAILDNLKLFGVGVEDVN